LVLFKKTLNFTEQHPESFLSPIFYPNEHEIENELAKSNFANRFFALFSFVFEN
jgi:hypothetical protein